MKYIPIFRNPESQNAYYKRYDSLLATWPMEYQELEIKTNFGITHVISSGSENADPIILLPGNYSSSLIWKSNISIMAKSNRVYAIDTMGEVGKSKPIKIPRSREEYNEWLLGVLEELKIAKVNILGISYGGFLAVNFAISYPDKINRVCLLCPGILIVPLSIKWAIRGMPMMLSASKNTIEWFIKGASVKGKSILKDPEIELFILGIESMRSNKVLQPRFSKQELRQIQTPIMMLVGEEEIMYDAKKVVSKAKELFINIEADIIPEAGHFLNYDQPEITMKKVSNFIKM